MITTPASRTQKHVFSSDKPNLPAMLLSRERASYKVSGQTRSHMCQCNSDYDDGSIASNTGIVDCHDNFARDTEYSPATSQGEASVARLLYPLYMIYSCFPLLLESMGQLSMDDWHLYSKMRRSFPRSSTLAVNAV
jgi:hypothetical protein